MWQKEEEKVTIGHANISDFVAVGGGTQNKGHTTLAARQPDWGP